MPPEPTRADLARELLLYKMKEYSQDGFCASWLGDLEFDLWKLALSPPHDPESGFPPEFFQNLHHLARIADGWWVWKTAVPPERSGPVFLSLAEWRSRLERT